jgi:hypothetical protein
MPGHVNNCETALRARKVIASAHRRPGFTAHKAERSSRYFTDLDQLKQALARLTESGPAPRLPESRCPGKITYEVDPS